MDVALRTNGEPRHPRGDRHVVKKLERLAVGQFGKSASVPAPLESAGG
jgi:hypothetical protein